MKPARVFENVYVVDMPYHYMTLLVHNRNTIRRIMMEYKLWKWVRSVKNPRRDDGTTERYWIDKAELLTNRTAPTIMRKLRQAITNAAIQHLKESTDTRNHYYV